MLIPDRYVERFIESGKGIQEVDWESIGYSSIISGRSSMRHHVACKQYPVWVLQRKNRLFLIRNDYEIPEEFYEEIDRNAPKQSRTFSERFNWMQKLFMDILEADWPIYKFDWESRGYVDAASATNSIRGGLKRHKFEEKLAVSLSGEEIWIFRKEIK